MKKLSTIRAGHVNSGTSLKGGRYRNTAGREFRHPKVHVELEPSDWTPFGGLSLAASLVRELGLPRRLDKALALLQQNRPYTESDHVLTHVYNLFIGGSRIEDISYLQGSEAARRMLGAQRIPDPTTAGDFLRRFDRESLEAFDAVIDDTHEDVWRRKYGKNKRKVAFVDLDSHIHHIYGTQKEAADFTYKGGYGYHPLCISLGETQEVLRLRNRPGNVVSSDGAGALLDEVFPLLNRNFETVIARADSAFAKQEVYDVCEEHEQFFAIVSPAHPNLENIAESVRKCDWEPFRAKAKSHKGSRKRGKNLRRQKARARGKQDLKLQKQWVAEMPYKPERSKQEYRLIMRRQKIEESNQGELFTLYRYRYVITNLPESYSAEEVMKIAYQRCDQENTIEQLQNGVSAMSMPTASFAANSAFLTCSRLAHNFKAWLAMLALPAEVMRWEWKRFRLAFVYFAARVVLKARQAIVRIADSQRFAQQALVGINRLQV